VSVVTLDSGITLSYSEQGQVGGPALVLLPGPTDSWRSYGPVLASLPERFRVVAVSLRGHGDSSKPPTGYSIEDLASDVVPFFNALGIERAVVAGHSGSCLVARRVALDAPDRVAGLVLEASPTTLRGNVNLREFIDAVVPQLTDPIDRDFARSVVVDTSTDKLAPELVDLLVDDVLKVPAGVWQEMFASLVEYDDIRELAEVRAPAMLVWGDTDSLVTREMQDELLGLIPSAELVVYEGVGHTPRWEQPERFAQDVTAFASRVLSS
jgi:non-heme chloroperoxidase